jgi:hypothetical protein
VTEMKIAITVKHIREPIDVQIVCRSKIRKWAYDNAPLLIFLTSMFFITWVLLVFSLYKWRY